MLERIPIEVTGGTEILEGISGGIAKRTSGQIIEKNTGEMLLDLDSIQY